MRRLYLGSGGNEFKFADTTTEIHLGALNDTGPATLTSKAKVRIKNDSGYLMDANATVDGGQAVITSGQLSQLPPGSYLLELWDTTTDGGTAIYPSNGFLKIQINENVAGLSGKIISSMTIDDFTKKFGDLSGQLKQQISDAVSNGLKGDRGDDGLSAYQVAVNNGYRGSQKEWLTSLVGPVGPKDERDYWEMVPDGAGSHNAAGVRGKNLGAMNDTYHQEIVSGRYRGMFLGDYFVQNGHSYVIAAFGYNDHKGDNQDVVGNIGLLPLNGMSWAMDSSGKVTQLTPNGKDTVFMNDTDTTAGGYMGSKAYKTYIPMVDACLANDFGSYLFTSRGFLSNSVDTNGNTNGGTWVDRKSFLMSEVMVYGAVINSDTAKGVGVYNIGSDNTQLPLFRFDMSYAIGRNQNSYWLRDVVSSSMFAMATAYGDAYRDGASHSWCGIRALCLIR